MLREEEGSLPPTFEREEWSQRSPAHNLHPETLGDNQRLDDFLLNLCFAPRIKMKASLKGGFAVENT